uniref:Peptidase A1 domain-containing protein n=1 Tax=Ditylenchus dipsaci TaxID=166011 RepID=A0A915DQ51_9BILA
MLLLGLLSVSQAVVHTITTVNHILDPGTPEYSHFHTRHQAQLKHRIGADAYHAKSQGIIKTENVYFFALANISVGTPAQTFAVETDFFALGSFILIDSKANLSSVDKNIPPKNTFSSSDSSTFTDLNENFTSWLGNGHVANDILALSDTLQSKVDFGVLDTLGYALASSPIDGLLGLAPSIYNSVSSNLPVVLNQLAGVLDEPVITIWTSNTGFGNGSSVGTLGAIDTEHCESNWIYVPQISSAYDPYSFHVSSVEMTLNGNKQTLSLDKKIIVEPYSTNMYLPESLRPWLVNSTNAVYDSDGGYYKVDCDISKATKLVFNIGGQGNTTSSANKQLVMSVADYVAYSKSYEVCYLAAHFSDYTDQLEINVQFMDNHCLAYNMKDKTIGIADSKTAITDVKKFKNDN